MGWKAMPFCKALKTEQNNGGWWEYFLSFFLKKKKKTNTYARTHTHAYIRTITQFLSVWFTHSYLFSWSIFPCSCFLSKILGLVFSSHFLSLSKYIVPPKKPVITTMNLLLDPELSKKMEAKKFGLYICKYIWKCVGASARVCVCVWMCVFMEMEN